MHSHTTHIRTTVHSRIQLLAPTHIKFSTLFTETLVNTQQPVPSIHLYAYTQHHSRIQLLAFFLNAYNLMVLHAHVVRGSLDESDFKAQKIPFTRDNQYMIAAYNYSLAEIEGVCMCVLCVYIYTYTYTQYMIAAYNYSLAEIEGVCVSMSVFV